MQHHIPAIVLGKSRKHILFAFMITILFSVLTTQPLRAQMDSLKCDTATYCSSLYTYDPPVSIVYYIDPNCSIEVSYAVRPCPITPDVRILSIKPYGCTGYSANHLMALAVQKLLISLLPSTDSSKNFRVLRNSCWRFDSVWVINWQGQFHREVVFNPCDSSCCIKLFRVIRDTTNKVRQLGTYVNDTCQYIPGNTGCIGICDTNESTIMFVGRRSAELHIQLNSTNDVIQRSFKQGTELSFSLIQNTSNTVNVKVNNIQGNTVYQLFGIYVPSGNHILNIPSDTLPTGIYELTVESGNNIIRQSVFQVY